jgi:hypothetical protein
MQHSYIKRSFLATAVYCSLLLFLGVACLVATVSAQETITVDGTASLTINFTAPTQYENGDALQPGDIVDYAVYWDTDGRSGCAETAPADDTGDSTCYDNSLVVGSGAISSVPLQISLTETTVLYFAVAAKHENGTWSEYSQEAAKQLELTITDNRQLMPPTQLLINMSILCNTNVAGVSCSFNVSNY